MSNLIPLAAKNIAMIQNFHLDVIIDILGQYIFIGKKPGPKFRKIYWIYQSVRQCKPLSLN